MTIEYKIYTVITKEIATNYTTMCIVYISLFILNNKEYYW